MFSTISKEAGQLARETAASLCWGQWAALGSMARASGTTARSSIVDPEALVLLSLCVKDTEVRLGDVVAWWASTAAHLTSVQRMRTITRSFPPDRAQASLGAFATMASEAGDRRWKRYARTEALEWVRKDRPNPEPDLLAPAALWPRLRAGFGVGAKADVLVYLLGMQGQPASVSQIATAIHYTKSSVRSAASDMSAARLLRETDGRPAEFTAPVEPWAELLELRESEPVAGAPTSVPVWTHWASLFAFLARVTDWADRAKSARGSQEHTVASEARDIVKRHRRALEVEGVRAPPIDRFPGRAAASGLLETTRALAEWV